MHEFCKGLVGQVGVRAEIDTRELDPYLAFRRQSIGVVPCIVFAEYGPCPNIYIFATQIWLKRSGELTKRFPRYYHDLRLPDEFFEHPSVKTIMDLSAEITVL